MREKQKKIIQWSSLALILLTGIIVWRVNYEIDFMMDGIPRCCMRIHRSAISGILSMRRYGIILTGAAEAWLTRCCR